MKYLICFYNNKTISCEIIPWKWVKNNGAVSHVIDVDNQTYWDNKLNDWVPVESYEKLSENVERIP